VLSEAEVVQQHGGAGNESKEEVARFFRKMGAASEAAGGDLLLEKSYLGRLLEKLRERSRHPLYVMWADVQRNYFTLPWAVVVEFVTVVTFVSSMVQTYTSIKYHG
jgi:hypothetical protein